MRQFISLITLFMGVIPMSSQTMELNLNSFSRPAATELMRKITNSQSSNAPYSINMTINGDPSQQMAFAWFTNPSMPTGEVQLIAKGNASEEDFSKPDLVIKSVDILIENLNYSIEKNGLKGIEPNQKVDYMSHKALATGLQPSTQYSWRVGSEGNWSEIGSFTTASGEKNEEYSFIYITDTQAQNDDMFQISQQTVHTASRMVPDAAFVLCNGDLVETSGTLNSEWEYEQWFATMQDVWLDHPLVVTMGNHDTTPNGNFSAHFYNPDDFDKTAKVKSTMPNTVFSFVRGNVLYFVINYEDWKKEGYLDSLADWMRQEVAKYPDAKWRVASYHKNMFTGSRSHQDDGDGKAVREAMLPIFSELSIDLAFQGHDHIYEVIGPVNNLTKQLVEGAIEAVEIVGSGNERENMTGKRGGIYNVSNGTLYFLNNSAGKKKYEPRNEEEMSKSFGKHEVENYWGLFSGRFGQTGEPTFSEVKVSEEKFEITTYTVDDLGNASEFDSFTVIKSSNSGIENVASEETVNFL